MIERGDKAKVAKQVFFHGLNDLDVFIEDTAVESKKIYMQLLKRVFGADVSLAQIFPIGEKSKVIAQCAKDQGARKRKAVYIVDGDHDEISGIALPPLIRLYRLKRYCIENYFIDENAVVSVLDEEITARSKEEIGRILDFEGWVAAVSSNVRQLIVASVVGHIAKCGLSTVNIPLAELCSCQSGLVDSRMISAKAAVLEKATDRIHGPGIFGAHAAAVESRLPASSSRCMLAHCSGKVFLLPLLKRRARHLFGFSHSDAALRLRLAMKCDVSELQDLVYKVA